MLSVIRFKCPHCGRFYEVSQLLIHLPLLCKGCGQRIVVPETSQEPEPIPSSAPPTITPILIKKTIEIASETNIARIIDSPKAEEHPKSPTDETAAILATPVPIQLEIAPNAATPTPTRPRMVDEVLATPRRKPISIVVDAMIGLFLLLLGGLLGEFLAQKSTGDVWHDAGSAPKFPPIDLLLWLAPSTMLILIYYLLVTKRKSLGAWLQRRSET
jgi:hypothetical protein